MTFAVEEAEGRGYKRVHRAGCRDLKDPEVMGDAATLTELLDLVDGYGVAADDVEELVDELAPCARAGLKDHS